jgi:hypothetical protein
MVETTKLHTLEGLDITAGEGDADLVDLGTIAEVFLRLVYAVLEEVSRKRGRARSVL